MICAVPIASAQTYDSVGSFYIGGFGQGGWHSMDLKGNSNITSPNGIFTGSYSPSSIGGGGVFGYDWRLGKDWFFGILADGAIDRARTRLDQGHAINDDFMVTARARLGVNVSSVWALDGSGGYGALGVAYRGPGIATTVVSNQKGTISGWVAGLGTEYDLDGFTVFAEYLYAGWETWRFNAPDQAISYGIDQTENVFRVGVKFKLGYTYDADIYDRGARRY